MPCIEECTDIFFECFPWLLCSESILTEKLKNSRVLIKYENNKPSGFSAFSENSLLILCVRPDYQKKGTGTQLLKETENCIKEQGYDRVILGRSHRDIFWGAVMDTLSHSFFEKRGYSASNGCMSMLLSCEDFFCREIVSRIKQSESTVYLIHKGSLPADTAAAVLSVEPKWLKYYENPEGRTYITAQVHGRTAGFMTVDTDAKTIATEDGCRTGMPGYIGVIPSERNRGIGLGMVAFALEYMKSEGCTEIFINYTSLDTWYSKIGFEEYLWYWMGEKNI